MFSVQPNKRFSMLISTIQSRVWEQWGEQNSERKLSFLSTFIYLNFRYLYLFRYSYLRTHTQKKSVAMIIYCFRAALTGQSHPSPIWKIAKMSKYLFKWIKVDNWIISKSNHKTWGFFLFWIPMNNSVTLEIVLTHCAVHCAHSLIKIYCFMV